MAFAHIQDALATPTAGSSLAKAFGSNVGAGNTLIAFATTDPNTTYTFSSPGDSWTTIGTFFNSTASQGIAIGFATGVTGGAKTVTVTYGAAGTFNGLIISEFSGAAGTVDVQTAGRHNTSSTTPTDASMTTTVNGDLLMTVMNLDSSGATVSAGSGFTLSGSDNTNLLYGEYQIQGSAGSIAATFGLSVGASNATLSAAIKPAGATGPDATWPQSLPPYLLLELAGEKQRVLEPGPTGQTASVDATVPVTVTIAATATEVANAGTAVPVTATIAATATEVANTAAAVSTTATIAADVAVVSGAKTIDATVPVTVTITANATEVANATTTRPITATIAATAQEVANATAAVATTATVTATATEVANATATRPTTVTIAATATEVANAQATVATTATITAALSVGVAPINIDATVPTTASIVANAVAIHPIDTARPVTATIVAAIVDVANAQASRPTVATITANATQVARAQASVATTATVTAVLSVGAVSCDTPRPFTGTTTYGTATTARPGSGTTTYALATTARPNTGETDPPCN